MHIKSSLPAVAVAIAPFLACSSQDAPTDVLVQRTLALGSVPVWADPSVSQNVQQPDGTFLSVTHARVADLNGVVTVDGSKYSQDAAGITQAIAAAPAGGTVFLSSGDYSLGSGLPIVVNKTLRIIGAGPGTVLKATSTGTSIFEFKPPAPAAAQTEGPEFAHFLADGNALVVNGIAVTGGTSSEKTNGVIRLNIHHVLIKGVSARAIDISGSGWSGSAPSGPNDQGLPVLSSITNSLLTGGIKIAHAGDTIKIADNQITGAGLGIDIDFTGGASTLIVSGNNISSLKGMRVGSNATAVQIIGNEFEDASASSGYTGSNGAVIDIDGPTASSCETAASSETIVQDNSIQIVNYVGTMVAVRISNSQRTQIVGNRFGRGTAATGADVKVTSWSCSTFIGTNTWPSARPFSERIVDDSFAPAGRRTVLATSNSDGFILGNNRTLSSLDETGAIQPLMKTGAEGSVFVYGHHGQPMMSGVAGANYLYDGAGAGAAIMATVSATGMDVGGNSSGSAKIEGRGAFLLAAEAACLASGGLDRFVKWAPGTADSCSTVCAATWCSTPNAPAVCVQGWTMWTGSTHYRYGSECSMADPSGGQGISGKLCCCTGSGCAQPMYK